MADEKPVSGHTPWRAEKHDVQANPHYAIADKVNDRDFPYRIIAEAPPFMFGSLVAVVSYDDGESRARLIAAAPELLDALTAAWHALRSYQHGNGSPDLAEEVADRVEALIAKAEGRS